MLLKDASSVNSVTGLVVDKVVERVREKLLRRSEKGQYKYGTTLSSSKEEMSARLTHLQEELMDGANYVEWVLDKLNQDSSKVSIRCSGCPTLIMEVSNIDPNEGWSIFCSKCMEQLMR